MSLHEGSLVGGTRIELEGSNFDDDMAAPPSVTINGKLLYYLLFL